jgi:hypothetical protein
MIAIIRMALVLQTPATQAYRTWQDQDDTAGSRGFDEYLLRPQVAHPLCHIAGWLRTHSAAYRSAALARGGFAFMHNEDIFLSSYPSQRKTIPAPTSTMPPLRHIIFTPGIYGSFSTTRQSFMDHLLGGRGHMPSESLPAGSYYTK